jgi:acyl-CoA hydrolase
MPANDGAEIPVVTAGAPLSSAGRATGEAHLDEWVAPDIADERGYLRAGKIFEWMDVVGVLAASRHSRRLVATASVDGIELRHPIRVGERVTMRAAVSYTSAHSMGVSVSMTHGAPTGSERRSLTGYMTFVALDAQGRPTAVPPFHPETPDEIARFREGHLRREFRAKLLAGQLPPASPPATEQERTLFTRELLKLLPRTVRLPLSGGDVRKRRDVSYVHKIEPIRGGKLNFHGTLYGGTLMRWIETSANLSARAYLDGVPVRLVGLHGLTFIKPMRRHYFVHVRSAVAHTNGECLTVLVDVQAEQPIAGEREDTLRAFLTYAPIEGKVRVPPLECVGDDELTAFAEVEHRLALQRSLERPEDAAR